MKLRHLFVTLVLLGPAHHSAGSTLFYNITWDGGIPPGTPAWADTGPFPRTGPSSVERALFAFPGQPTIEPDESSLDGALLLHAAYEGISLGLDSRFEDPVPGCQPLPQCLLVPKPGRDIYTFSLDLRIEALGPRDETEYGALRIYPWLHDFYRIDFSHDGVIRLANDRDERSPIGTYSFGSLQEIVGIVDFSSRSWSLFVNEQVLAAGTLSNELFFGDDIRIAEFGQSLGGDLVYVDNVRIEAAPEPTSGAQIGVCLLLVAFARVALSTATARR